MQSEQPKVVAFLLSAGALPGYRNALHYAAKLGDPTIATLLLEAGANPNQYGDFPFPSRTNLPPLHIATCLGHRETVISPYSSHGAKLKDKANVSEDIVPAIILERVSRRRLGNTPATAWNRTPLDLAIILNFENLTKLLIEKSNSTEDPERIKTLALVTATEIENEHLASILLEAGANIDGHSDISPPLSVAIERRVGLQFIKFLIEAGASPNVKDTDGNSPLHLAAIEGKSDVIRLLGKAGADFNTQNKKGQTPIFLLKKPSPEALQIFIDEGSDLDIQDDDDYSPLIKAITMGWSTDAITALLANGADPNLQLKSGDTALHLAAKKHLVFVELLLKYKADPDIVNAKGLKPEEVTRASGINTFIKKHRAYNGSDLDQRISVVANDGNFMSVTKLEGEPCRYKLFEMIIAYDPSAIIKNVSIARKKDDGQSLEAFNINMRAAIESKDPKKDIALEWGDIIDIHDDTPGERGISLEAANFLDNHLCKKITADFSGAFDISLDLTLEPISWEPSSESGFVFPSKKIKYRDSTLSGAWNYFDLLKALPDPDDPFADPSAIQISLKEITRKTSGDQKARYTNTGTPLLLDGDELKINAIEIKSPRGSRSTTIGGRNISLPIPQVEKKNPQSSPTTESERRPRRRRAQLPPK